MGKGKKVKKAAEKPEGGKKEECPKPPKLPNNGWTNKIAREKAEGLGFEEAKDAPFNSHGQLTFKKGSSWITPDIDGHRGAQSWKVFDSSGNRLGTYSTDLLTRLSD